MSVSKGPSSSSSSSKSSEKPKRKEKPLRSLVAGAIAGAVEGFLTYPTDFVKTQSQFSASKGQLPPGPIDILKETIENRGLRGLYAGCSALVAGNALKAGVRFLSYDSIKLAVADKTTGQLSLPRSIVAGFLSGLCEGAFAVTPSEAIKTRLIEDGKRHKAYRRYKGLWHGTKTIVKEEGLESIYRGLGPTMMRQGANSAVRLTTYSMLRGFASKGGRKPGTIETFGMGSIAGIVTNYSTMPVDVVKTRMQSERAKEYKSIGDCVRMIIRKEGVRAFWKGSTPRLVRLIASGGITFTIYETTLDVMEVLGTRVEHDVKPQIRDAVTRS